VVDAQRLQFFSEIKLLSCPTSLRGFIEFQRLFSTESHFLVPKRSGNVCVVLDAAMGTTRRLVLRISVAESANSADGG
jgi:hypothetical protein